VNCGQHVGCAAQIINDKEMLLSSAAGVGIFCNYKVISLD
jgi:hypothetical protein